MREDRLSSIDKTTSRGAFGRNNTIFHVKMSEDSRQGDASWRLYAIIRSVRECARTRERERSAERAFGGQGATLRSLGR